VRAELMWWTKFLILACPLLGLATILVLLVGYYRPIRRILNQFDCPNVTGLKIGPFELSKRSCPQRAHARRRKKVRGTRQ
jgi:hypothetical protein